MIACSNLRQSPLLFAWDYLFLFPGFLLAPVSLFFSSQINNVEIASTYHLQTPSMKLDP